MLAVLQITCHCRPQLTLIDETNDTILKEVQLKKLHLLFLLPKIKIIYEKTCKNLTNPLEGMEA